MAGKKKKLEKKYVTWDEVEREEYIQNRERGKIYSTDGWK